MVLDGLEEELVIRGGGSSIDECDRSGEGRVGPHLTTDKVFLPKDVKVRMTIKSSSQIEWLQ